MENKKAEEIKKKAEADASKILKEAERKGRLIIEEAKKKADALSGEVLREVEQKGRLIIEEARKKAESQIDSSKSAPETDQKARHILEDAKKKAEAQASKITAEAEQKGRLIIEEAQKVAASQARANKPAPDVDQKAHQIIEEAKKKAEAEANRITAEAEQKGRLIIEEAQKVAASQAGANKPAPDAESKANTIIAEAERKARLIIEEAERIAAAPANQRAQEIVKAMKGKTGQREDAHKKRVEIVIIPPVDFAQLEKLRTSLHRLPGLRILSIGGSPGGITKISLLMHKPAPIAESLKTMDAVDEAVEEELLDSHPLRDFVKQAVPGLLAKRLPDEQRILLVLKKAP